MTKPRTENVWVRGALGVAVELTPAELAMYLGEAKEPVQKRRRRCTFLPGVNPKWDAEQSAGLSMAKATVSVREWRAKKKLHAGGTIRESHFLDPNEVVR